MCYLVLVIDFCAFPIWDTDFVSVRQGSKPCIAHAVKIVFVPVVLLRPFGPVYYWLFLFFGGFPISEDYIGSYATMDNRRFALCHARFFVAQMPETALRIYQTTERQVTRMNVKKRRQEPMAKRKWPLENWQHQKVPKSSQVHSPMIRVHAIPRRTRRGC